MMRIDRVLAIGVLASAAFYCSSCAQAPQRSVMAAPPPAIKSAIAVIHPTEGNSTKGIIRFTTVDGGVKIVGDVEGLEPNSKHGFHIHQYGDCSAANGKSAGGHYNPESVKHAGPDTMERHAGDLGNLQADANGKAHYEMTAKNITINGAKSPILGRGIIIHAKADDLTSQPTGAAGPRIGCGTIGIAKE